MIIKNCRYLICTGSGLLLLLTSCKHEIPEPVPVPVIDSCSLLQVTYSKDIAPLIASRCSNNYACHGAGAALGDFTTYQGLMQKVNGGMFYARVILTRTMPMNGKLSHAELQKIQCWLDAGTPNN